MGLFDSLVQLLGLKKKEAHVLVVGLDNSGKSTVVNFFKSERSRPAETVPTIGFNVEKLKNGRLNIVAFDMSGQSRYRSMWERYYQGCHGVIFVVDSSDTMRMSVAKNELHLLLQHPDMSKNAVPILILANKADLSNALPSIQVRAQLALDDISQHPWNLVSSNALNGDGLTDGLQWLSKNIMTLLQK